MHASMQALDLNSKINQIKRKNEENSTRVNSPFETCLFKNDKLVGKNRFWGFALIKKP